MDKRITPLSILLLIIGFSSGFRLETVDVDQQNAGQHPSKFELNDKSVDYKLERDPRVTPKPYDVKHTQVDDIESKGSVDYKLGRDPRVTPKPYDVKHSQVDDLESKGSVDYKLGRDPATRYQPIIVYPYSTHKPYELQAAAVENADSLESKDGAKDSMEINQDSPMIPAIKSLLIPPEGLEFLESQKTSKSKKIN